jgi:hypothetical protein
LSTQEGLFCGVNERVELKWGQLFFKTISEKDSRSRNMPWSFARFKPVSGHSGVLLKALNTSSQEGILKLFNA